MKNSLSIDQIRQSIGSFFARYHGILYFIVVASMLGFAILTVLGIIETSGDTNAKNVQPVSGAFDESTIDKLKQLNTTNQQRPLTLPNGRVNPFSE